MKPDETGGSIGMGEASALLQRGYAYWRACAGSRAMPRRADIDPADMKDLLPNVVLIEVLDEPRDFVERVTGDTVIHHSAHNSMGIRWRDYPGRGPDSRIWAHYAKVVDTACPKLEDIPYVGPHRDFLTVQLLSCPLSADGATVDRVLSFVDYLSR